MTPLDPNTGATTRVSIIERVGLSFGLVPAAVAGAVGGAMTLRFLNDLRNSEAAGYSTVLTGTLEIEVVVGTVLAIAAIGIAIGVLVSAIRIFTNNKTASPPGILFLLVALLAAAPPLMMYYVIRSIKRVAIEPVEGGLASVVG
ncbi:MAG: hypothetical protein ACKVQW_10350 [Pyrinomonadaceae bacterium]